MQVRVYEPENSSHREVLQNCGFHFCKKDNRWEKNFPGKILGDFKAKDCEAVWRDYCPHTKIERA